MVEFAFPIKEWFIGLAIGFLGSTFSILLLFTILKIIYSEKE